jgi:hypothetical protein
MSVLSNTGRMMNLVSLPPRDVVDCENRLSVTLCPKWHL